MRRYFNLLDCALLVSSYLNVLLLYILVITFSCLTVVIWCCLCNRLLACLDLAVFACCMSPLIYYSVDLYAMYQLYLQINPD